MNIVQLNAQLQRFPTSLLVQLSKQYGLSLRAEQIDAVKRKMQKHINANSTLKDVENILYSEFDAHIAKQLLHLLTLYFVQ